MLINLLTITMEFHAVVMPSPDSYEQLPRHGVVKSFAANERDKKPAPRRKNKATMFKYTRSQLG